MCYFAAAGTSMTGFQTVWFKSAHRRTVRGSEGERNSQAPPVANPRADCVSTQRPFLTATSSLSASTKIPFCRPPAH